MSCRILSHDLFTLLSLGAYGVEPQILYVRLSVVVVVVVTLFELSQNETVKTAPEWTRFGHWLLNQSSDMDCVTQDG